MPRLPIQAVQPIRRTDPQVLATVRIDIIDGIVAQTVLTRLMDKMRKYPRIRVEPVQTAVKRADPQDTVAIRHQRMKTIAPRTVGIGCKMFVVVEPAGLCIELAQTLTIGSDPYGSLAVIDDRIDIVTAQTGAVSIIMLILADDPSMFADPRDAIPPGPPPQIAPRIFIQAQHIIPADAFAIRSAMDKMR